MDAEPKTVILKTVPRPKGLPLIGNLHQLSHQSLHLILEKWRRQYGDLFRFRIGLSEILCVSDVALIQKILLERPDAFRRMTAVESVIHELAGPGLFSAEGKLWRRQRKLTNPAFHNSNLNRFFPTLLSITERLRRSLERASLTGQDTDIRKILMSYTVDLMSILSFAYDVNSLEGQGGVIQESLETVFKAIARRVTFPIPYWRFIKLPVEREAERAVTILKQKVAEMVKEAQALFEKTPELREKPDNLLQALLVAKDESGSYFSSDEIFGNVFTLLLAGEDTTANSMSWIAHFLTAHPEVQSRVQREVDAVLGDRKMVSNPEDLNRLLYLDAVALEAMRLRPVAPFLFFESNQEVDLGGLRIPKGTKLTTLFLASLWDERNFTHALEFRPERWLDEERPSGWEHHAKVFMPFGGGPRFCPGRSLAFMEIKVAISALVRNFQLLPSHEGGRVSYQCSFVAFPSNLKIRLKQR